MLATIYFICLSQYYCEINPFETKYKYDYRIRLLYRVHNKEIECVLRKHNPILYRLFPCTIGYTT